MSRHTIPRASQLKAVLLDAGNTLVFLDHDALAEVVGRENIPVSASDFRRAEPLAKAGYARMLQQGAGHEQGWNLFMEELLRAAGAGPDGLGELVGAVRRAHDAFNLWRRVPAELPGALRRLRAAGLQVGVVSNSEGQLDALFERVGLAHLFDLVVDSAHEGVRKPDPKLFRIALERLGCDPKEALYAGDIPDVDITGAHAAGLAAVLVDAANHHPDHVHSPRVASVAELVEQLLLSPAQTIAGEP